MRESHDEQQPLIDGINDDSETLDILPDVHLHSRTRSVASTQGRSIDYTSIPSDTITTQAILSLGHSHAPAETQRSTIARQLELAKLTTCPAVVEDSDIQEVNHNKKKLILAITLCFLFFIVELVAGIVAGSLAILSDSFHLLSDIAGFGISLIALYLSQQPATSTHSFGFYRAEILGAIISTLLIWLLTAALVWEAINRIQNPQPINGEIMFYTAAVGVLVNIVLGFTLHGEHDHSHGGHSHNHSHDESQNGHAHDHSHANGHQHANGRHSHSHDHEHDEHDEHDHEHIHAPKERKEMNINIKSAALHVIGDLISSIGVLISAAIIWIYPNMTYIDPICTFVFSALVMLTTFKLMSNSLTVLMEGTPAGIDPLKVANDLRNIRGVVDVHDLHIWNLTIGKSAMAVHLDILPTSTKEMVYVTTNDFNKILNQAQDLVCSKYGIHHSTIQLEMITASHGHHSHDHGDTIIDIDDARECECAEGARTRNATHCLPPMCRKI